MFYSQAHLTVATRQRFPLVFDSFVTFLTFLKQLSGGFLLNWPIKTLELREGEFSSAMLAFL